MGAQFIFAEGGQEGWSSCAAREHLAAHLCLQVVPALCQLRAPLRQAEPRRTRQPQLVAHRQVGPLCLEQQGHVPNVGHIMQRQHMAAGHLAEVGLQQCAANSA